MFSSRHPLWASGIFSKSTFFLCAGLLSAALSAGGCGGSTETGSGGSGTTTTGSSGGSGGAGGSGSGGIATGASGGAGASGGTGGSSTTGSGGAYACSGNPVSYAKDVEPILHCGSAEMCHQLSLGKPGGAYPFLVNQPTTECPDGRLRVAPGDPENSYLVDKLTNQGICDGKPMPKLLSGAWTPLSKNEIQTVYDWICQGAKDD